MVRYRASMGAPRDRSLFLPEGAGAGSYQQNISQKHMTPPPFVKTKKVMTHPLGYTKK